MEVSASAPGPEARRVQQSMCGQDTKARATMRARPLRALLLATLLPLFALLAPRAAAQDKPAAKAPDKALDSASQDCLECHADASLFTELKSPRHGGATAFVVDKALFARSVHGGMACSDCHMGFEDAPHTKEAVSVTCASCHQDEADKLAASVHGGAKTRDGRAVTCTDCHGIHDVLPPTDRDSHLHPLNVYKACGQCHFSVDPQVATVKELLREPYADDAHAHGLLTAGLISAATCVSCHGGHEIRGKGDPASTLSRQNVDKTCGACHVGVAEQYRQSVHAVVSSGVEHKGATCTDCHKPHAMKQADADFRSETVQACAECHAARLGTYNKSYHGKLNTLGSIGTVATCSVCHGSHQIQPQSDPRSTVNKANIVSTCAQCHADAQPEFASFEVHADPSDPTKDARVHTVWLAMRAVLISTLIAGGLHVLLWLNRAIAAGALKRKKHVPGRYVRRWRKAFIVFHVWMMSTVLLLASTGLPLHYADQPWALSLMTVFGGPVIAGVVHRIAAIGLVALAVTFVVHIAWRYFRKKERGMLSGPSSMLPRVKDLQDVIGTVRWFLFRGPQPRYDRWTYWEKFDFWAAGWGLFVIGLSGLILWFPVTATRYVPGWVVNCALVIHGIEALLDIAFIFTVHAFHANLRPDKFPIDTMFLTGRIPESEFREERPAEYDRAVAAGTLESLVDDPPSRRLRIAAYVLGGAALAVGFLFVILILIAVTSH
jgi:cytochrome b subunit of formate dehydrogenase/nitrate/TMAO reductase-like tetraheme cytochrome c subunit